ncbi:DUF1015 family protein [Microlunatus phosphovorus]|uniref:DUF1015 family protein n=1 Tax=Microlunatus phosphovorus TaxID=29405 RepID=UPI0002DDE8A2|nr:DUF1015 domain-containing protein [Microlunatus phosphovorus]
MPRFRPFAALRYADTDQLASLIAPPYDVLSDADLDHYLALDEHNVTHVDVPRGGDDRYEVAAATLADWCAGGVLVGDDEPSFTLYRLSFTDETGSPREIVGVLGGLEVVDAGAGGVLPHERTTPKASTDRLDLTRATRANLSPVWGLSLSAGLAELLAEPGELIGEVIEDGVRHRVERVTDPDRIAAIAAAVGADDVLIADGHHRYGISRIYRDEVRAATGRTDTPAEETLTFVSELVADQLSVAAIHRLYDRLYSEFSDTFTLTEMDRPTPQTLAAMQTEGFLVLYTPDRTYRLDPIPGAFHEVRSLDGAWLEHTLGEVPVTYQHGLAETLAAVDEGRAACAVLIRPVSVAEIERTAREGLLMPPKSTFFTPKLKTGFVIRPL